jgi:LCP family protein required for cell wall assembly
VPRILNLPEFKGDQHMIRQKKIYLIKKRKTRRNKKRIFMFFILPILLLLVSGSGYAYYLYEKAEQALASSYDPINQSSKSEAKINPDIHNTSVLFIGIDDSKTRNFKENTRTDALILATFNEKQKSIKLLSIPRDSYVYIPEKGEYSKINHAHSYGGVKSTIETVEELLDIPVDYYVKMNFNAFIEVVDALDGVKAEVPYEITEKDSNDRNSIHLEPGIQELNGEEALALVRTRKKDNDIERGKRQQEIMMAIMEKARSAKSMTKYAQIIDAVGNNMKTNLTFKEMKSFVDYVIAGKKLKIETLTLAGEDNYIDHVYYYKLDEEELELLKDTLKHHLDRDNYTDYE